MNTQVKRNIRNLQAFYLLAFFGVGSLYPLLSVYLSEVEKLNGYQIGTILSVGPIVMIFFQPLWGIMSDMTNAPVKVLTLTTAMAGIFGLGFLFLNHYLLFLIIAILISVFQSAMIPVSDSISLKYTSKVKYNYGNVRLFGSLGFGVAVFIMGRLSDWSAEVIFWGFFIALSLAAIMAMRLPKEQATEKNKLFSGMKDLFKIRKFVIFLAVTFMIFGPNLANNFYFSLFVEDRGGTYTGIGIAFLIAVLSEIPFMRAAGKWINKFGLLQIAAFAGTVSMIRWFFYFMEPSLSVVYASAVVQGVSLGLFIPAGLQYIREITPVNITATAVTVYSAIGNGLGNWFSTFLGGVLYEEFSIYVVYLFFAVLALIGVVLCFWLIKEETKSHLINLPIKN
ncbi:MULTISPECIES: MFS transporter [unclassified Bacillus (in: firmicutes)]|uniref:MFS transporter n=1 Tax=unclassified Bacillus (in: firmicutes) TaxID=185979 RepID=UPI0008EE8D9C|nr:MULTISPECIES: MFS transporter [unclassified Bacillus (in: firmicutes)]SFA91264.1 MFS transporter, PPP family, 3-phenylpropionic acid transporter [Bacillus sp. UNCCL13]SFQ85544.1 MFS transporter, PPP family, 3-phenylpropionic acid transporter [Bacillus sp. cl95]